MGKENNVFYEKYYGNNFVEIQNFENGDTYKFYTLFDDDEIVCSSSEECNSRKSNQISFKGLSAGEYPVRAVGYLQFGNKTTQPYLDFNAEFNLFSYFEKAECILGSNCFLFIFKRLDREREYIQFLLHDTGANFPKKLSVKNKLCEIFEKDGVLKISESLKFPDYLSITKYTADKKKRYVNRKKDICHSSIPHVYKMDTFYSKNNFNEHSLNGIENYIVTYNVGMIIHDLQEVEGHI